MYLHNLTCLSGVKLDVVPLQNKNNAPRSVDFSYRGNYEAKFTANRLLMATMLKLCATRK